MCQVRAAYFFVGSLLLSSALYGAPAALFQDPGIIHNVYGITFLPPSKRHASVSQIYISPFYQCAPTLTGARNNIGMRVPTGERLGRWNMLGLFFGNAAAPLDAPFQPDITQSTQTTAYPNLELAYKTLKPTGVGALGAASRDYTSEALFINDNNDGFFSVPLSYEKFGVRFGLMYTAQAGFGFAIKGGFGQYLQTAEVFTDRTGKTDAGQTTPTEITSGDQALISDFLMRDVKRQDIFRELFKSDTDVFMRDLDRVNETAAEDTYVQLHWTSPIALRTGDNEHNVEVAPFLAIGAWLPTGRSQNPDLPLALPTGNDGFTGISFEGALNFDFFDMGSGIDGSSLLFGFGGGVTFFDTRSIESMRLPSSIFQSGIYPWKTSVRRRLGTVWNLYASFVALSFIKDLSFFLNYVYTQHEADAVTVTDPNTGHGKNFLPKIFEERSVWNAQTAQGGFRYDVAKNLSFGLTIQAPMAGKCVYRTATVLGMIDFVF